MDLSREALSAKVDNLRAQWAGHHSQILERNRVYLRAFSPEFSSALQEHDQWPEPLRQSETEHFRSSYNLTRAVAELWTALEASEFPSVRWWEQFVPSPVPSLDEMEVARRQLSYRAEKQIARHVATMREQRLMQHVRRTEAGAHFYRAVLRKNVFGHSWLKTWPAAGGDELRFRVSTRIDPSTVFPVWSYADDDEGRLDAILVAYRRSAFSVNAEYPGLVTMARDGVHVEEAGWYTPTGEPVTEAQRAFVWVEDFWILDERTEGEPGDDEPPMDSRVANLVRINGKPVRVDVYEGWRALPYVLFEQDNLRDRLGFSDVATMLPFQDSTNRFMSQQQDVIAGEARPKFKYRTDSEGELLLEGEQVIRLEPDEDVEQLQVSLDVFPTQVHGQQLMEAMSRATGLPDTVWGRITAAQNSGRALATAWRAVAARLVPRVQSDKRALKRMMGLWLDWIEIYSVDGHDLYAGNRDFDLDFPNQEPRDFTEVSLDAINRMNAGLLSIKKAMETTGESSPDERIEEIRADYTDEILHPEKMQSYLLLRRLEQSIALEAQQAGIQAAMVQAQLQGAGNPDVQARAASQARTQAAQQAAPVRGEGQNQPAPAAQAGAPANSAQTRFGTLVQDGQPAMNRVIDQGTV